MSDFPMALASEMGVSRRTVQRWCEARKVPGAYRTKGGHWRLRRPTRIKRYGRYDGNITNFVIRYTSERGYSPAPIPDSEFELADRIMGWLIRRRSNPAPPTLEEAASMVKPLEWLKAFLER